MTYLKSFAWFIVPFLVMTLVSVTLTYIFSQTVLKPAYLDEKAKEANVYKELSVVIPQQILKNTQLTPKEQAQVEAAFATTLTPEVLQQKFADILSQADALIKQTSGELNIDIADIKQQLQSQGVQVPMDDIPNTFTMPEAMVKQLQVGFQANRQVQMVSWIGSGVLLLLLIIFTIVSRSFGPLTSVLGLTALFHGAVYFGSQYGLRLIDGKISFSEDLQALQAPVQSLIQTIGTDVTGRFLGFGIIYFALTVAVIIFALVFHKRKAPETESTQDEKTPIAAEAKKA